MYGWFFTLKFDITLFCYYVCVFAKSRQSCLTLCDPINCSPSGSPVQWILQAWILEWVAMPSSRDLPDPGIEPESLMSPAWQMGSSPLVPPQSVQSLSRVRLFASPWTAAHQASLSITSSQSNSNSCPLSRWCHPTISSSVVLLPPSLFPSIRVFSNESVLHIRWPQ